jgi:hypothetical protein
LGYWISFPWQTGKANQRSEDLTGFGPQEGKAMCWWYRKYALGDTVLDVFEPEARTGQKGFWANPQPIPPWRHRDLSRN